MSSAEQALTNMAAQLRAMPSVLERVMPKLQRATRDYLDECYARGVDPDGTPWPLTERGEVPKLRGEHVEVVYQDYRIIVRAKGHEALHTLGKAKARAKVTRSLLPKGSGIPPVLEKRWRAILEAELKAAMQP